MVISVKRQEIEAEREFYSIKNREVLPNEIFMITEKIVNVRQKVLDSAKNESWARR